MKRFSISRLIAGTLMAVSILSAGASASTTFVVDPQDRFDITEGDYRGQESGSVLNAETETQGYQVQETAQSAVPEPATWLLLILGFAFIALASGRRRKTIDQFS